jgi:hypothetical protein
MLLQCVPKPIALQVPQLDRIIEYAAATSFYRKANDGIVPASSVEEFADAVDLHTDAVN